MFSYGNIKPMTLEQILANPFERVIKIKEIVACHLLLLEPFKVYGNTQEVLKENQPLDLFSSPNRGYDGRAVHIKSIEKDQGYVVFEPKAGDEEQIQKWRAIGYILDLICQIRRHQLELSKVNTDLNYAQELKREIQDKIIKIKQLGGLVEVSPIAIAKMLKEANTKYYSRLKRKVFTYEDWLNGNLRWEQWYFRYGEVYAHDDKSGIKMLLCLPEEEYNKIKTKQQEVAEDHIKVNLDWYISNFEQRFKRSREKEEFINKQIKFISKILEDKSYTGYRVKYDKGQRSSFRIGIHVKGVVARNTKRLAQHYQQIIVNGDINEAQAISPEHVNDYSFYIPEIAVIYLYRFRKYLYDKVNKAKAKTDKNSLTVRQWAMFYRYLQLNGYMEMFENEEGGKQRAIKRLCDSNPNLNSWKNFEFHYNAITKTDTRLTNQYLININIVIQQLSDYPKALEFAEKERKKIKRRNS